MTSMTNASATKKTCDVERRIKAILWVMTARARHQPSNDSTLLIILVLKEASQLSIVLLTIINISHCNYVSNLPVAALHNP